MHDKCHKPMMLLNFFVKLKKHFTLVLSVLIFFTNFIFANEVSDTYQIRYQRWLSEKESISSKASSRARFKNSEPTLTQRKTIKEEGLGQSQVLPSRLPRLSQLSSEPIGSSEQVVKPKMALDAVEEFENAIPKDNTQVQALLNMVEHTKVFFTINSNGTLKELFNDDRFREIFFEEMKPDTRRQAYNFFKGYQDHHRLPNEPVSKSLKRDQIVNRERIDSYLETTGVKAKLTRSLDGSYPKPKIQPKPEPVNLSPNLPEYRDAALQESAE